jgi:hypothetical protein
LSPRGCDEGRRHQQGREERLPELHWSPVLPPSRTLLVKGVGLNCALRP